ncbi:PD-(D/E)XK nuclease family protein [Synechococcus sp. PCC 6312]|uniref:PD-(D/E)XK nuclease family protein n=1 Tax=Synechococcus sp. (strain ATCC 27167 / PCC 6312) TaxID=195253 RepID=UPI00029F1BCE|nr:PD-(D/E)XK nuclease family protein [Synechococcus sp. PCC 6312]AFY59893.1 hypothetical protein Syn6312_0673 [Synechococcus sp. PCC 6312]
MPLLDEPLTTDPLVETPGLSLTQSSLQALAYCPRKFQYLYLDQLGLPNFQAKATANLGVDLPQDLGTWFHRLLQQRELGLDITPLLQGNEPLPSWYEAFQAAPPPMILGQRDSEHRRQVILGPVTLVGIYDLVIWGKSQAQILDWKTYQRPQTPQYLQHHWQTRLYPYLLAATTDYPPESIVMTYWFALGDDGQHSLSFRYSQALHRQTQQRLEQFVQRLEAWLLAYDQGNPLPQVDPLQGRCPSCEFAYRCHRQVPANTTDTGFEPEILLQSVQSYPEISLSLWDDGTVD